MNDTIEKDYSLLRTHKLSLTLNGSTRRELEHLCIIYDISFEEIMEIAIEFGIYIEDSTETTYNDLATSLFNKMTLLDKASTNVKKVYPAIEDLIVSIRVLQMELEHLLPRREWINPKARFGIYEPTSVENNAFPERFETVWDYFKESYNKYSLFLKDMDHSIWPKNYILSRTKCNFQINNFVYNNLVRVAKSYNVSINTTSSLMVNNMLLLLKMEVKHRTGDLKEDLISLVNKIKSLSNLIIRLCEVLEINYYKILTSMDLIRNHGLILQTKIKAGQNLYSGAESGDFEFTPRQSEVVVPSTIARNPILPL